MICIYKRGVHGADLVCIGPSLTINPRPNLTLNPYPKP